jgi:hypothetical protein
MQTHPRPFGCTRQNQDSDLPVFNILLIANAVVGRQQEIYPSSSAAFSKAPLTSLSQPSRKL